MKSSKELEQEIIEEKARYESLRIRKVELEKELKEVEQELKAYRTSSYSSGKIQRLESELMRVQLIEESESLPRPVLYSGAVAEDSRIFKVTPKRIYIRSINKNNTWSFISEDYYSKDGNGCWKYNIPESLKVWEKYNSEKSDQVSTK
jgi:hypothetical protein